MILISLVENAFKHGTSPTEKSFVHINISTNGQQLICDIQNSNNPKTASDHSGHGIGLQQVERRLQLAYPDRYTWEQGTRDNDKTYYSTITIQL
jgi:LytS/YehU family sensor histidine kinase